MNKRARRDVFDLILSVLSKTPELREARIVDTKEGINEFETACTQILSFAPPVILYHYCPYETFLSIFKTKKLRNSHIQDMNDKLEFSHGMKMFASSLDGLGKRGASENWIKVVGNKLREEACNPRAAPFAFSMTPNKNQPRQWELYGVNGTGVSLGFRSMFFKEPRKVLYDCMAKRKVVRLVRGKFVELVDQLKIAGNDLSDSQLSQELAWGFFRVAFIQSLRFKEGRWKTEEEWRGLTNFVNRDSTEIGRASTKRYVEVDIEFANDLLEVVTGPKITMQRLSDLESLKTASGLNFKITQAG